MSRSSKDIQPHWRPNFVNPSKLPDIKVIRTDFIINSIAVTLLIGAAALLIQKEYRIWVLSNTIEGLEEQVTEASPANEANLKKSSEFRDVAKDVAEVEAFFLAPFTAHEFLAELAQLRPESLIFNEVSLREVEGDGRTVTYRIRISGEVRHLTDLDAFKGMLDGWDMLDVEGYSLSVDESVGDRDDATGIFPYRLSVDLLPANKKGGS